MEITLFYPLFFTWLRNTIYKERDKEEQRKLAEMGWHCITVWECELTPKRREETLESLAFTLNHIWLQDHRTFVTLYPEQEEEDNQMPMAAEDEL